ncbi:RagB/SusD family nutrient uptake outer membrane protein [Lewinella sp. 4G2]|uniref:RagB/SusD family nutrient uptake outer membrane protein n=1 Tax=Lewinella sp. 4G2 TaxID=1803372 RepID=UPI0007B4A2A5|nr:RagB/SusD family nutrient uptake outer membrane protein [Lewinella sp. 4G2]OAV45330.1 hypothetical protein A3850_012875 [Lewinella sp. 4G2]
MLKKTLLLTGLAFSVFSCGEEFLDRQPIDTVAEDNFFQNQKEVDLATLAIYTALQSQGYYGEAWSVEELPSDDARRAGGDAIDNFATNANNGNIASYWNAHYRAITLANIVINKAPEATMTDEERAALIAEARFLRGISYFNLVRVYGGVPIITEIPKIEDDLLPSRNSVDEVYAFIKADLEPGTTDLPISTENSRATIGAAKMYLAYVHLTLGEHEEASALAKDIIDSGVYSLLEDYGDLWDPNISDNNAESIFEIQYAGCRNWGTGNMRQAFFAPFGQDITRAGDGWGVVLPTTPQTGASGTTSQDIWEDGDLRRYWTLMEAGNEYKDINPGEGYIYPDNGAGGSGANIKKYVIGGGPDVCFMSTPQNASLMRLSDAYLVYAEAEANKTGGVSLDPQVLEVFNAIRIRAGLEPLEVITLEDIDLERRREYMFEGKRWFDIKRKGDEAAVSLMRLAGKTLTVEKLVQPLPANELELNPNLTQNPGY